MCVCVCVCAYLGKGADEDFHDVPGMRFILANQFLRH